MYIHYLQFGKKGLSLVFLHGWQQDSRSFLSLVGFLHQDYRLFLLDLPGFGQSQIPPLSFSSFDYAKVIVEWLKKKKLKKVILIGHSFGGKIAAIISAENPEIVDKLILIDSSGLPHNKVISSLIKIFPKKISQLLPHRFKMIFASRDYKKAGLLLPIFKRIVKENIASAFAKIKIPTLIIWGKDDEELSINDGKKIHSLIRKSKLILMEGDHFPFWQDPQKTANLIKNFIEK